MLNKSPFLETLMSAQWKISQSGSISQEKLHVYWEEFKNVQVTDEQFATCVQAVSRQSKFFPKVAEIWDEVDKTRSKLLNQRFVSNELVLGIPKPPWFSEVYEKGKAEQKAMQDRLNSGKYLGSQSF